ncbi:tryptophan synthase subunit alpha [Streptomyces minutiscleroticus]|uniref:tryptophan synthase subunit alpha n=1 Tax=Streptomyces minutiscleroticus TaxID=68238 RepID=UPI003318A9C5
MTDTRLQHAIRGVAAQHRAALAAYLPVGWPDRLTNLDALHLLAQSADVVELGVPHTAAVLDGPVIRQAAETALRAGFRMTDVFHAARELSAASSAALLVMSYYQPVHAYGLHRFAQQAAAAGIDGVLIPDLPAEEAGAWRTAARAAGLAAIPLVSPRTRSAQLSRILAHATGLLYAPATSGVTGTDLPVDPGLPDFVGRLRALTPLPIATGIGITSPERAHAAAAHADVVVVGSALIRRMQASPRAPLAAAAAFGRDFAAACHRLPHAA